MKEFKLTFILFFITTLFMCAQRDPLVLHTKESGAISGFGRIKGGDAIKFWEAKDQEPEIYYFEELDSVAFKVNGEYSTFIQRPVKGENKTLILEKIVDGEVSVCALKTSGGMNFNNQNLSGTHSVNFTSPTFKYYLLRKGEDQVTFLGGRDWNINNFKKNGQIIFC